MTGELSERDNFFVVRRDTGGGLTIFHVQHGMGPRYYAALRNWAGTIAVYDSGGTMLDGDGDGDGDTIMGEGGQRLSNVITAVVRDFIASGKRTPEEEYNDVARRVLSLEIRRTVLENLDALLGPVPPKEDE